MSVLDIVPMPDVHGARESVSDPFELELIMLWIAVWVLKIKLGTVEELQALLAVEPHLSCVSNHTEWWWQKPLHSTY